MKKRTLSLLLALMMLVSALPIAVSGETKAPELEVDADGYYLVNEYQELHDHLWASRNNLTKTLRYRLAKKLSAYYGQPLPVFGVRAEIDLNGFTLENYVSSYSSMISVNQKGHLTIRDTSSTQTGAVEFTSRYADRPDLDDEDTGRVEVIRIGADSTLEVENGTFRLFSKGAIFVPDGGTVRIYDGVFEAEKSKDNATSFAFELQRTSASTPASAVFIYGGIFRTSAETVWIEAEAKGTDDSLPLFAVFGGEFYTDNVLGFNYSRGAGVVFIGGGLISKGNYEDDVSKRKAYADGSLTTEVTLDDAKYYNVTSPQWLVTDSVSAEYRFNDAAVRHVFSLYDESSDYYAKYGDLIKDYTRKPLTIPIGERDLDNVDLRVYGVRSGVKRMRLFSSVTVASNWADTTWNLVSAIDSPTGEVVFNVARPMKKTTTYYRLRIEYENGTEWSDYIGLDFAEPAPVMSGTAFPTMNAVAYGNTLFCGLKDLPEDVPVDSLRFEWFVDGVSVGTERKINLNDPSWVGKKLTARVTSTVAEGAIVSAPSTIARGTNRKAPVMPSVSVTMTGTTFEKIDVSHVHSDQEYLISKKTASALTADDWAKAEGGLDVYFAMDNSSLSSQYGVTASVGDTLYVHTRYAATDALSPGTEVLTASVYVGDTVYLNSITFPEAINGTIYIAYYGYETARDIAYTLNPGNANAGGDIRWRVSNPLTVEDPTAPVAVKDSEGYVTVSTHGLGSTTLSAYYQTSIQLDYGKVNVVVYDPKNVGPELLKPAEPLQDVTIYAGNGYSCDIPTFIIEPTTSPEYSWYFTRGTTYGFEKVTDVGFATIDTATGEITTTATGSVTVSLFADNSIVDSYVLTAVEKPDDYIALEALFAESAKITLNVGDKREIKVLKSPANATADKFTYASSNPFVAEVSADGVVTGHSQGTAQITVSAPSDGVSVKIDVTVNSFGAPSVTPGDANGDGKINAKDVTAIMKHLVSKTPKDFVEAAADFDGNGKINAKDVTGLMKYIVKMQQQA